MYAQACGSAFNGLQVIMRQARQESQALGHSYVGTEHLLLALVGDEGSMAVRILQAQGAEPAKIAAAVKFCVGRGTPSDLEPGNLTRRAKAAIELAREEAWESGTTEVRGEHLLMGLLREENSIASAVLEAMGVTLEQVRRHLVALSQDQTHMRRHTPVQQLRWRDPKGRGSSIALTPDQRLSSVLKQRRAAQHKNEGWRWWIEWSWPLSRAIGHQ